MYHYNYINVNIFTSVYKFTSLNLNSDVKICSLIFNFFLPLNFQSNFEGRGLRLEVKKLFCTALITSFIKYYHLINVRINNKFKQFKNTFIISIYIKIK